MSNDELRRSARMKAVAQIKDQENDAPQITNNNIDHSTLVVPTASKRRRKTSTKTGKQASVRLRGKLKNLPQMPLDVLFEILQFLTPLDLLRLARTTKDLRSTLMKRSALTVWKAAYANVPGIPECPEGVTEPAYANFMFTTNCYECLNPRATHCFAPRCLRYCKNCVDDKVFWNPAKNDAVLDVLLGQDLPLYTDAIAPGYLLSQKSGASVRAWLRNDFNEYVEGVTKLFDDEPKLSEFVETRKGIIEIMKERQYQYTKWVAEQQDVRANELEEVRRARCEAIKDRLTKAGWGIELENLTFTETVAFRYHPLVKQPRPLTDRIWNNIEADMLKLMLTFRESRLKRERRSIVRTRRTVFVEVVESYARTQPVGAVLPSAADLYFMESVESIKRTIEEAPNDTEFSSSDLTEFTSGLPQLCEEWRAACTAKLMAIYDQGRVSDGSPSSESVLHLAKTVFKCDDCSTGISYPFILNHRCFSEVPDFLPFERDDDGRFQVAEDLNGVSWMSSAPGNLQYVPAMIARASQVVRSCGFNPDNATQVDLDGQRIWLIKEAGGFRRQIMGWRRAIQVVSAVTSSWSSDCQFVAYYNAWTKLEDEALIQECEGAEIEYYARRPDLLCVCVHCRACIKGSQLTDHIAAHNPGCPLERSDFWLAPDTPYKELFSLTIDQNVSLLNPESFT